MNETEIRRCRCHGWKNHNWIKFKKSTFGQDEDEWFYCAYCLDQVKICAGTILGYYSLEETEIEEGA